MAGTSQSLRVRYGTFSCKVQGFDDNLRVMKDVALFFRDLVAEEPEFATSAIADPAGFAARVAERLPTGVRASLQEEGFLFSAEDEDLDHDDLDGPQAIDAALERLSAEIDRRDSGAAGSDTGSDAADDMGVAEGEPASTASDDRFEIEADEDGSPLAAGHRFDDSDNVFEAGVDAPSLALGSADESSAPTQQPHAVDEIEGSPSDSDTGTRSEPFVAQDDHGDLESEAAEEPGSIEMSGEEELQDAADGAEDEVTPEGTDALMVGESHDEEDQGVGFEEPDVLVLAPRGDSDSQPQGMTDDIADPEAEAIEDFPALDDDIADHSSAEADADENGAWGNEVASGDVTQVSEEHEADPLSAMDTSDFAEDAGDPAGAASDDGDDADFAPKRSALDDMFADGDAFDGSADRIGATGPEGAADERTVATSDAEGTSDRGFGAELARLLDDPDFDEDGVSAEDSEDEPTGMASPAQASRARRMMTEGSVPEEAIERLMHDADDRLEAAESEGSFNAIQRLRHAVMAADAPKAKGRLADDDQDDADDLVEPEPMTGQTDEDAPLSDEAEDVEMPEAAHPRSAEPRDPPMVLVSSQRVDAAYATASARNDPPRGGTAAALRAIWTQRSLQSSDDRMLAAATLIAQASRDQVFTRSEVMELFAEATRGSEIPAEERMRAFGLLLRHGRIRRADRGTYALAERAAIPAE